MLLKINLKSECYIQAIPSNRFLSLWGGGGEELGLLDISADNGQKYPLINKDTEKDT